MATMIDRPPVVPWWERSGAPWHGRLFDRAILRPEDPEEGRIQRLRAQLLDSPTGRRTVRICMHRARLVTESYRQTEGEHPAIRRAKALYHVFAHIPIPLPDEQLLIGSPASEVGGIEIEPEFSDWAEPVVLDGEAMTDFEAAVRSVSRYRLAEEDLRVFREEVLPYWRERGRGNIARRELVQNHPEAEHFFQHGQTYLWRLSGALYHTIQDYRSVLERGVKGLKQEINEQIAALDASRPAGLEDFDRLNLYRAMLIVADGLILYAQRCADLCEERAGQETDRQRRTELLEMARICRKVPAGPADTWWEALQSFRLAHMATALAEGGNSHSAGRFDQYMLPYLRRDLENGRTTAKQAQELLECFFLKYNEVQVHTVGYSRLASAPAMGNNDKITIGGTDEHGRDLTNELSHMLLEAHVHVHLNDPNLSVRLHRQTPDDFLKAALEVVRLGGGLPLLMSDEAVPQALMASCGVSLVDARNYADMGCQENGTDPNSTPGRDTNGRTNAGWFNLAKPVELAIWNGRNPVNGVQVGPQTGDPRRFGTMEEFFAAVRRQTAYAIEQNTVVNNIMDFTFARHYPCVYHDLMHPGPRQTGIDIEAGGCFYDWTGSLAVGLGTAGDMLSAIDHLVYQTKQTTWDELLAALAADWEGYEELRQRCLRAPKYGTDDDFADGWAKRHLDMFFAAYEAHPTPRGGHYVCGLISMGSYIPLGKTTGATPDGRRAGDPLSDSTSPSLLAPALGPTAAHRSATKVIDTVHTPNGVTFNQKFNLAAVETERELSKWADLVRTYVESGGQSVQYNVVDAATLRAAQKDPREYRDLIVRVGGYSALFVDLSEELQDTIIARADQSL